MRGHWKESFADYFVLLNEKNRQIATVSKYGWGISDTLWELEFLSDRVLFHAKNSDVAKWKATNEIINMCNNEIGKFSEIRDHLPSVHELAEKAGVV